MNYISFFLAYFFMCVSDNDPMNILLDIHFISSILFAFLRTFFSMCVSDNDPVIFFFLPIFFFCVSNNDPMFSIKNNRPGKRLGY